VASCNFNFVVRGTAALSSSERKEPMNAISSENLAEQLDVTEEDPNIAAVADVEAGIRDFVRNDVAYLRRPFASATPDSMDSAEATVSNVNSLIQRVAGTSLGEIEKLINELESLRDMLHAEGERVQREIAGYAQLSQSAMKSTRIIAENMAQWKSVAPPTRHQ
jgi:hypothetical protein